MVPEKIIGENRQKRLPLGGLIEKVFFGPKKKTGLRILIKLAEAAEKDPTVPVSRYAKILWSRYFLVGLLPLPVWVRVLRSFEKVFLFTTALASGIFKSVHCTHGTPVSLYQLSQVFSSSLFVSESLRGRRVP